LTGKFRGHTLCASNEVDKTNMVEILEAAIVVTPPHLARERAVWRTLSAPAAC